MAMINTQHQNKSTENDNSTKKHPRLSGNELNCLCLTFKGKTSLEIAYDLNISVFTVNTYKKRIMTKFCCRTMSSAIYKAMELGYLKDLCK